MAWNLQMAGKDMDGKIDNGWAEFSGLNAAYLTELYEIYQTNPNAVEPAARAFFERHGPPPVPAQAAPAVDVSRVAAAIALSTAIRMFGYRAAQLDPLGGAPPGDSALRPETHGIGEEDLAKLPAEIVGGPAAAGAANALDAIHSLRRIYEGTSGYEFEHVSDAEERNWLRAVVESGRYRPPRDPLDERRVLERLTQVEAFERFVQSAFPTQTRFSIEGLDMLVPMLDELMCSAAGAGTRQVLLGMAHRGRLNVLAHVLGRPYEQIIAEFQGAMPRPELPFSTGGEVGWTGDVRYHLGGHRTYPDCKEVGILVTLAPNPSHLEFVDPVVEGMARAASERREQAGPPEVDEVAALAVLVHGEAAFVGEGITAETLNLSRLPGYRTGGTVHLIANNQVGFTTPPALGRSTLFASDLAKGFEIPVVHVNADDPEACIAAIRLAEAYVAHFHKDVVIDVIGYRRWGHNEGDEPTFTQPKMYEAIANHPRVRELWAHELVRRGLITSEQAEAMLREAVERLQAIRRALPKEAEPRRDLSPAGLEAGGTRGGLGHAGAAAQVKTAVPEGRLRELNEQILALPAGFHLHPKLVPLLARRRAALAPEAREGPGRIDWGHTEVLAFASILADGIPIRLTGQDTARGTFGQRHMVLHDAATGRRHVPLQHFPDARAAFAIWDSPLSEQGTVGFEYGYNVQAPETLTLWEAQYGDFVNVAQVIVDEFIASGRSKWAQRPSLVLLLPHGYEGQGPDHSSARIERFLQMAAEDDLRIANCTTAAQYFHILRRQAQLLTADPRPLVIFTPKSLLRQALTAASLPDLADGRFQPVIDDVQARRAREAVRRLVLCSGKVAIDLELARDGMQDGAKAPLPVAIVRMEELYPFPAAEIETVLAEYPSVEQVVWAQEEPRNMGPWLYVAPRLRDLLGEHRPLLYVGRTRRASPAEATYEWHVREQKRLLDAALLGPQARAAST